MKTSTLRVLGIALTGLLGFTAKSWGQPSVNQPYELAQLFYPPAEAKPTLRVIGKGEVRQPADRAELMFEFQADPFSANDISTVQLVSTAASTALEPVVKALVAQGINSSDITISQDNQTNPFSIFPLPNLTKGSTVILSVQMRKPTQEKLSQLAEIVAEISTQLKAYELETVKVQYTVDDCSALETAVYRSALDDARQRASAIASAMGAAFNPIPSVAQPFYDLVSPGCGPGRSNPFFGGSATYDLEAKPEVTLFREVFVTYTLQ